MPLDIRHNLEACRSSLAKFNLKKTRDNMGLPEALSLGEIGHVFALSVDR